MDSTLFWDILKLILIHSFLSGILPNSYKYVATSELNGWIFILSFLGVAIFILYH
jgi:hypothetical protein